MLSSFPRLAGRSLATARSTLPEHEHQHADLVEARIRFVPRVQLERQAAQPLFQSTIKFANMTSSRLSPRATAVARSVEGRIESCACLRVRLGGLL